MKVQKRFFFSADGFGTFGALDAQEDDWACEARRYYFNICGKYGVQVQNLLKKPQSLIFGKSARFTVLYLTKILVGTSVFTIHGASMSLKPTVCLLHIVRFTATQPRQPKSFVKSSNQKPTKRFRLLTFHAQTLPRIFEDAFRFSRMVVIAPSYDGGVFPIMNDFLHHLKIKGYKNRKVAMVENGSWAPSAAKTMRTYLEEMKNVEICPTVVTIRSAMKEENIPQLEQLSDEILG